MFGSLTSNPLVKTFTYQWKWCRSSNELKHIKILSTSQDKIVKINCKSFVKVFINSFLKIFLKKYVTCLARQVKIAAWVLCILQMLRAEYCIPINDHIGTTNRAVPGYRYIGNYRVLVVGFRYQQNWTTLRIKLFCTAKALYKYIRKIVPCIYVMFYLLKLNWNIIIINI